MKAVYKITSVPARRLEFSVLLDTENIIDIHCINCPGEKKTITEFGKKKAIFVSSVISCCFEIEIIYTAAECLSERKFKKYSNNVPCASSMEMLDALGEKSYGPIDLAQYCNSDKIRAVSAWRNEDLQIDLTRFEKAGGMVEIRGIPFNAAKADAPGDDNVRMVLLEHSKSHPYTGKTIPADYPGHFTCNIGKMARGLVLLYACECQSRQTGVDVGAIKLNYINGTAGIIPLNVGKNLDTLFSHFAGDTMPVEIRSSLQDHPGHPGTDYINLLFIPCDSERIISNIEFTIELPDVQMGLIGISLVL